MTGLEDKVIEAVFANNKGAIEALESVRASLPRENPAARHISIAITEMENANLRINEAIKTVSKGDKPA